MIRLKKAEDDVTKKKTKGKPLPSKQREVTKATHEGPWRIDDLPVQLQVELRDRVEQAKRGEGLEDFDEALADAERMTEEMLAVTTRHPPRPAE